MFYAFLAPGQGAGAGDSAHPAAGATPVEMSKSFGDYWFQGKAELTSYALSQARYGELREGTAVMMFVAEDFSPRTLTKLPEGETKKVPVLKINFEKRFNTGIYPYHMMMTCATPIDYGTWPHSLKMSTSSAEWCGATFTQLNLKGGKYMLTEHSYFPNEGDLTASLPASFLEDEIWTRIRIAPDRLPVGSFSLIHNGFVARLLHQQLAVQQATATLTDDPANAALRVYKVSVPAQGRSLEIWFDKAFPHGIDHWTETYTDGFGSKAKPLTTTGKRIKTIQDAYWSHNAVGDSTLRKELGLETQVRIQR